MSFGVANTEIVAGCKGSAKDKSCLFDEFINKIRAIPKGGAPKFKTDIGPNLLPDPKEAAAQLSKARFTGSTDAQRLLPYSYKETDRNTTPTFSEVFDKILAAIKACRNELRDELLATQLLGARDSMAYNQEARVADQHSPDGSTYEKINTQATLDAHPEVKADDLSHTISAFTAEYSEMKTYKNHFAATQASQGYQSVLNSEARE
ncbi:hypothetical protein N7478_012551 [Penicillium angulare]|uniref:uncharacterized protein n=1 Tax=Penicillium angulare TaxID=116970 RepID=UPI00254041F1|nr:uncharacterized protein N7478_012551 [Penicillium angulare]KAJ5259570.1 hypothetical protein N7478_012551 [Penicillium angulare]